MLQATLLGDVRFDYANTAVRPSSRKGTALLAYLSLRTEGVKREDLAELLWGPGRLANLRQELYALRQLPGAEVWLADAGEDVSVRARSDVADLHVALAGRLLTAGSAELLPGLGRLAAPAFLDWLEVERRRVSELLSHARREAAERLMHEGAYHQALAVLEAALGVDPLDERLVRAAMRVAYAAGDAGAALARCERFRNLVTEELGLPPAVETLELERLIQRGEPLVTALELARLDADLKGMAQVVAVADGALDVELLARVVERRALDVAADLARLERGGWLAEDLRLVPEAAASVHEGTPAVMRRLLHQRVAQALGASPSADPGVIAEHLLAAERAADAAPMLVAAAERAIARGALGEAVELLLRASWAAWDLPQTRIAAALLLEGCCGQLGEDGLQDAALAEAEELAWRLQSDRSLADVRMRRSRTLLRRGQAGEGLESALEALEIATRLGDQQLLARARNAVGGAQFYAGDLDGAEASFAGNASAADPVERYRARNNLGSIAGIRGRVREALDHLEAALTLGRAAGEQAGVVGTLNNLAATAERVGDYRRAVKYFREGLKLTRQAGAPTNEGQLLVNLAVVYSRVGELGPAWNTALEVEEMADEHDEPRLRMLAYEQQAEVAILCGDLMRAGDLLADAHALASEIGDERKRLALAAGRAVVEARGDRALVEAAEAQLEDLAESRWADVTPWLWLELALAADEPRDAVQRVSRAAELAGENAHLAYLVDLARLRAGLLEGANASHREAASGAYERLADSAGSEALGFVQAPQARLLLASWRIAGGGETQGVTLQVRHALTEQAAGLPKELRESLLRQPTIWLAGLTSSPPLTPD